MAFTRGGSGQRKAGQQTYAPPSESTRLLYDSSRITHETEEIGILTEQELRAQREKLEESGGQLKSMQEIAQAARTNIKQMEYKAFRQKLYLWIIIVALFILNVFCLVTMLKNSGKLYHIKGTYNYDDIVLADDDDDDDTAVSNSTRLLAMAGESFFTSEST